MPSVVGLIDMMIYLALTALFVAFLWLSGPTHDKGAST